MSAFPSCLGHVVIIDRVVNRPKEQRNTKELQFLTSAVNLQGCPNDQKPEVAIIGRSNAGKSSLINGLANSRVAQVSSTPGKTRLLNFYQNPEYRLVDMPGYGFSARSGPEQSSWQGMIEPYLSTRPNLIGLLIVMDIRRNWTKDEEDMIDWMEPRNLPSAIVLTKGDKLNHSDLAKVANKIEMQSGIQDIIVTSALKKLGFKELKDFIYSSWIKPGGEP